MPAASFASVPLTFSTTARAWKHSKGLNCPVNLHWRTVCAPVLHWCRRSHRDVGGAGSGLDACSSQEASRGRCFHEGWELPGLASHPFCGQAAAGRKNAGTASGCFSGVGVDVHIKPSLATATVASPSPISRCSWHFLEVTTGAVCSQHQSFCRIYTLWL